MKANSTSPVYWAIKKDQYATLQRLIDNGADVNMIDEYSHDYTSVIIDIIADFGLEYDWRHEFHHYAFFTPLALAAYHGRNSMVELLLDNGARLQESSNFMCDCCRSLLNCPESLPDRPKFWSPEDKGWEEEKDGSWWKPLHYAICRRHVSTVKLLLERGASASNVGGGVSALHIATRWEVEEIIEYLLDNNLVDINLQARTGATALHIAYVGGRYDLVNDYLDRGADINLKCRDWLGYQSAPWTIFAMACADGDFDRALQYLRRGADPNFVFESDTRDAWTVMRFIYKSQSNECADPLLKDDPRIELEKEIIAGGRKQTTSNT